MTKEIVNNVSICTDCVVWAYNGEDTEHGAKMLRLWACDSLMVEIDLKCDCSASEIMSGDCQCDALDDHYFSWKRCDGCGSDLGGDRWDASLGLNY